MRDEVCPKLLSGAIIIFHPYTPFKVEPPSFKLRQLNARFGRLELQIGLDTHYNTVRQF